MKLVRRILHSKKLLLWVIIVVFMAVLSYTVHLIKVHRDTSERFLESFRITHDNLASLSLLMEKQITSVYYQLTLDPDLGEWLNQEKPTLSNMYMLGEIQKNSLQIINSNPLIASVYIYSKASGMVLSSNHEFTRLEEFPEKELFTSFRENNGHWVGKRTEKAGYGPQTDIITFIGPVGDNGLVAVNVNEQRLLSKAPEHHGLVLMGKTGQVLTVRAGQSLHMDETALSKWSEQLDFQKEPVHSPGFHILASSYHGGEWKAISITPQIELSASWTNQRNTITAFIVFLIVLAVCIHTYIRNSFFQPIERLEYTFTKNLEDLKHHFVLNVLTGKWKEEDILDKRTEMRFQFPTERFMVIVFQIDDFYNYLLSMKQDERFIMDKTIYNAIKWTFMTTYACYCVKAELEKIAILVSVPSDKEEDTMLQELEGTIAYLQREIKDNCSLTVCAGISCIHDGLNQAHSGYYEALQAIGFKAMYGKHSIIRFQSISSRRSDDHMNWSTDISQLCAFIKDEQLERFEARLQTMLNVLLQEEKFSLDRMNAFFSNVLYGIVKLTLEQRLDLGDIVKEDIFLNMYSREFLEDKQAYVNQVARKVYERQGSLKTSNNKTIQLILDYIQAHYDKSISLTAVSESLGINASYISTLMKQEVGYGFVEYLNQLRIKKAEQLLADPSLPIKNVSEMCGYDTVHSFIRNFKKLHLFTPSEYRSKLLSNRNV